MMKKIIVLLVFFWFCSGCRKEEAFRYSEPLGGIQFDYETMVLNYDFAFRQNAKGKYMGDSLQYDTLKLAVAVVGYCPDYDQVLLLDTVSVKEQEPGKIVRLTFLPPYIFHANQFKDTVKVVIHRPAVRGTYKIGVTFDWNIPLSEFGQGVKEKWVYQINVTDLYPEPENWNKEYFGEFSEEKYAFYVTIIGERYESFKLDDGIRYNRLLRNALTKYNREHPDTRKNFDFPEI